MKRDVRLHTSSPGRRARPPSRCNSRPGHTSRSRYTSRCPRRSRPRRSSRNRRSPNPGSPRRRRRSCSASARAGKYSPGERTRNPRAALVARRIALRVAAEQSGCRAGPAGAGGAAGGAGAAAVASRLVRRARAAAEADERQAHRAEPRYGGYSRADAPAGRPLGTGCPSRNGAALGRLTARRCALARALRFARTPDSRESLTHRAARPTFPTGFSLFETTARNWGTHALRVARRLLARSLRRAQERRLREPFGPRRQMAVRLDRALRARDVALRAVERRSGTQSANFSARSP